MKKEILLGFGLLFCVNGFAQNIQIEDSKIREKDDNVFVTFTIMAEKIKSNEQLILTPVLYSGDKSKHLESITITGRNRAITDLRQSASAGIRTTNNQRIPYIITVPYEDWMSDISLRIDRKMEGCCTEQIITTESIVLNKPIRYDLIIPQITPIPVEISSIEKLDHETAFLASMADYNAIKDNLELLRTEGALIVNFRQGSTDGSILTRRKIPGK